MDYPMPGQITNSGELYAEFISAPASSPTAIAEHMQQNQITFEIPTARDLRRINALHSFNALLQRISGSSVSYNALPAVSSISTEQLSNSVVLDLADLRNHNELENKSTWQNIFGDADNHVIINYLWMGVVISLVLLSVIFILFSCYFHRKFRTWNKCNKDVRVHVHAANDTYSSVGVNHHLISCDSSQFLQQIPSSESIRGSDSDEVVTTGGRQAAFFKIESPPCYTIATGLPSYDEALHHHPRHFTYGMQFMYPSLTAALQPRHHHCHYQQHSNLHGCITNCDKDAVQPHLNKLQKCKLSATVEPLLTEEHTAIAKHKALSAICISMPEKDQEQEKHRYVVACATTSTDVSHTFLPAAAANDDSASLFVVVPPA